MAGNKKSKIYIYFVSQYKNNPKIYINFVGQYNKCIFLLGFDLSDVQSFNKPLKEWNNQTILFF